MTTIYGALLFAAPLQRVELQSSEQDNVDKVMYIYCEIIYNLEKDNKTLIISLLVFYLFLLSLNKVLNICEICRQLYFFYYFCGINLKKV